MLYGTLFVCFDLKNHLGKFDPVIITGRGHPACIMGLGRISNQDS